MNTTMENSKEKKIRDIMIPFYDFPTVSAEASVKDALLVLNNAYTNQGKPRTGRNMVFVVEDNELAGIFGITELMAAIVPPYLKTSLKNTKWYNFWTSDVPFFWEGHFVDRCLEVANEKVLDYMRPIEKFIDVNDTLLKAAYSMVKEKADSIAVKDKNRLVGMVRSADVFREITEMLFADEPKVLNQAVNSRWAGNLTYTQSNA